jgi:C4-dicarboxylate-specific signal transduction histidine kinase
MRSLSLSPLTTQVLLWVIGISVLVFTTVTIVTAWHENEQLFRAAQENARRNVARNLPAISTGLWNFDRPSLYATLMAMTQYGSVVRAQVLDPQRKVVVEIGRSLDSTMPESEWEVPIVAPDGSKRIGTLGIAESYQEVREASIRNLVAELVSELAKTVVLAALLFLVVYALITRHLQGLARQVANLTPGNVVRSIALRRKPRRDELDTLVDSINRFRAERTKAEEALLNDIAERKRIEAELKQTQTELSEALQIARLAYWEFDGVSREFAFNDQYYSFHRITAADAGGYRMELEDFCRRLVHPQDASALKAYIEEGLRVTHGDELGQLEIRILCADGTQRWTLVHCSVERGANSEAARLIGAVQDTTERKRSEDALQATQSELARVAQLSTMGQMAASIAHEINQPLAAIVANGSAGLHWLAGKSPNLEEGCAALKRIVSEGHRAASVIAGIRAMFKKDHQEKAVLAVNPLIGELLTLAQGETQRNRVSVETALAGEVPEVLANRVQLQQVIFNLITNAIDAMSSMPDGPRVLRVKSEKNGKSGVLISVEDSGPGLDEKTAGRIFEPFFTTKAHGMGMGLSICRSIIEAHNGRLTVESHIGRGSVFRIGLPPAAADISAVDLQPESNLDFR